MESSTFVLEMLQKAKEEKEVDSVRNIKERALCEEIWKEAHRARVVIKYEV